MSIEKTTLTISLPRTMKNFIDAKIQEGRFSTPSEYIRSLIRDDQDLGGTRELALWTRHGILSKEKMRSTRQQTGKKATDVSRVKA